MKILKALEVISGYCDKHPHCSKGCIFSMGTNSSECLLQKKSVPADWKEIIEKIREEKK